MDANQKYDLQQRLVKFSAGIILNAKTLNNGFVSEHLMKQLIRSATSAALNYGEAQSAESKRDFKRSDLLKENHSFKNSIAECKELVAIFTASIKTVKSK